MAKKSKSMIGHDPLAWLKNDAEDAEITKVEEKPVTKTKAMAKKKPAKKAATKSSVSGKEKDQTSNNIFELQSIQDIFSVAEVYNNLKKLLENKKIILDGANVERIDAASLQLLYALIEEAKVNDIEVVWQSPSDAISNAAKLLGMADALQLKNIA